MTAIHAVLALATALQDSDPATRLRAAHALGKLGADAVGAAPALIAASQDEDVRRAAAKALKKIGAS